MIFELYTPYILLLFVGPSEWKFLIYLLLPYSFCIKTISCYTVTVRLLEDFDSAMITGVYSATPSGSIVKQVI